MRARQHIGAAVAVFQRDIVLFGGAQLLAQLIQAVFIVTLFYYVSRLLHVGRFGSSDAYFGFVVAGLVVLRLMIATLGVVPTALRQELVAGTFERLVVSPFGPLASILSMMLFPLLNAIVGAVFIVGFAALAFGLTLSWQSALLALPL
jgi:ABC-type multidrug transport system permease subunit